MMKNIDLERRSVDERNSDHFQELQKILDYSSLIQKAGNQFLVMSFLWKFRIERIYKKFL